MNSSEAVLANRFIRVFYHQDKPKVHQRLGPAATSTAKTADADKAADGETSPEVQKQKEQEKAAVSVSNIFWSLQFMEMLYLTKACNFLKTLYFLPGYRSY